MLAGKLRQRVALQPPTYACDSMGQNVATYTTVATVWAQVEPMNGREFEASYRENSEITVKIIIRYYAGVGPAWRVVHGTHTYEVIAALNLMSGKTDLKLMCKEIPAAVV